MIEIAGQWGDSPRHLEGRHTDGSCAFCDYVGAHRRAGNL
jgi:hypothetical protein